MQNEEPFDPQAWQDEAVRQFEARLEGERAAARQLANRRNAMKSTGPRTPEGKAASSRNRLAHGLCSNDLLLPGELQSDFDQLRVETHATYLPATAEENVLADQLTESLWRLNRARRVETRIATLVMQDIFEVLDDGTEPVDRHPDHLLAAGFFNNSYDGVLNRMQRYATAAERGYQRALKALQQAQKNRPAPSPKLEPVPVKVATANGPLPEVGFEPHFAPTTPAMTPAFHNRP